MLELFVSTLPLAAARDPAGQGDEFEIQPEALPLDVEGVIFELVMGMQVGIGESKKKKE